jgi:peptidyl-prolyl cis-trans isomerase A (cyclophilin A)
MKKLFAVLALMCVALVSNVAHAANPQVMMKTNQGMVLIELYPEKAPKSVENFLRYVRDSFYDGTIFHRVIDGFMIQGGGFEQNMQQKQTRAPIQNEARNGLRNEPGTIAMARTSDPNSATAQFFINLVDNGALNYPGGDGHGYAVFGKVVEGWDVVQRIAKVQTGNAGPHQNVPRQPVIIHSIRIAEGGAK